MQFTARCELLRICLNREWFNNDIDNKDDSNVVIKVQFLRNNLLLSAQDLFMQ